MYGTQPAKKAFGNLSTAEYLDALWACRSLGFEVRKDDENWQAIRGLTLFKPQHLKD
ncbi:hypothetical protein ACRJ4W_08905 [Streptomyces sp. GLT-R25]